MSQSLLGCKAVSPNQGAYRVVSTTPTQLGPTTGTSEGAPPSTGDRLSNRVLQINAQTLLMWINSKIFRSTDGGANWVDTYTMNMHPVYAARHTGLHIIDNAGTPIICGIFISNTGAYLGLKSVDLGLNWTEVSLTHDGQTPLRAEIVYQNRLFISNTGTAVGHLAWDAVTDSISRHASPVGVGGFSMTGGWAAFGTFNKQLYKTAFLNTGNAGTQANHLWRFVAEVWEDLGTIEFQTLNNTGDSIQPILFDGMDGFMYTMYWEERSTGGGLCCQKIAINPTTGAPTFTNVSTDTIPMALRTFGVTTSGRLRVVYDQETDPTTAPKILIYVSTGSASSWTQFLWNGGSAQMTQEGVGLDNNILLPDENIGGGHRIYTPDSDFFIKEAGIRLRVTNGNRIKFTVQGPLSNETVNVAFYYSTDGGPARTRATLGNPSDGSYNGALKQIEGLGPADGTTVYEVDVLGVLDGIAANTRIRLVGRAF